MATHRTQPDDMRLNLVLIGPPGSGKGTQAVRLAEHYEVPHISTGDILRAAVQARSALGRQVADTLASGGLVGDELMADLVRTRLAAPDAGAGFVLDGFPRTVMQAQALDDAVSVSCSCVARLRRRTRKSCSRLGKRRVCGSCGITQSVSEDRSQCDPCPYCGGRLVRRAGRRPATVRHRLATYATFAAPIELLSGAATFRRLTARHRRRRSPRRSARTSSPSPVSPPANLDATRRPA